MTVRARASGHGRGVKWRGPAIALGAVVFNVIRPRIRDPLRLLAASQVAVPVLVILGLVFVIEDPSRLDARQLGATIRALIGAVMLVVLPVTIILGIAFPASSALLSDETGKAGTSSGQLLAVNTFGAICGSLLIPFFLIPAIGSPQVVALLAATNGALAAALVLASSGRLLERRLTAAAGIAVLVVALVLAATPGLLVQPNETVIRNAGGRVFESAEDEIASVQAGQVRFTPELWVAGTSMTLLTIDAKLMPILPLMAHPEAEDALIVAFGMGSSYRSSVIAGVRTDAVELVPSVVEMFEHYYPDAETYRDHPNGRIIVADGRNHLELSGRTYDIIVTDPPPPIFSSGASVISSYEYYLAGRAHLNPGGIMMQWVPLAPDAPEFRDHLRSFTAAFPEVAVARGLGGYGSYMLGSETPVEFTDEAIRSVLERPGVLEDVSSAYDSPESTVDGWLSRIRQITAQNGDPATRAGPGPLITDDRPLPEYFLLQRLFGLDRN